MKKFVCILLMILSSCLGKKSSTKEITEPAKESVAPVKEIERSEREIRQINFFLETSASMAGYFKGSSDFVKNIPNLLVDIEGKILNGKEPLKINYIASSVIPYTNSTQNFIRDISTTKVASSKSSEMHRIFELIANKTSSNDISLFVSDCILSYPDSDIKADTQINRDKAEGGLKADIKATFTKLKNKNIGASLYAFNSSFTGTYYTYENNKLPLNGEIRPYYLWVIGNKQLVQKFNNQLIRLPNFKNTFSMNFGLFDPSLTVKKHDTFFLFKRAGKWVVDGEGVSNALDETPAVTAFAINLRSLPFYAQNLQYLNKHLKGLSKNGLFKIKSISYAKDINKALLKPNEIKIAQNNTHVVLVEILNIYDKGAFLRLLLPIEYDSAYKKLSIMDDRSKDVLNGKTFAFEHLIDGVKEAYDTPDESYINISIPIKK